MASRKEKKKTNEKNTRKPPVPDMAQMPGARRPTSAWFDSFVRAVFRFQRFGRDIGGVLLLALASITLLALIGLTSGAWLSPWAAALRHWLGWGSVFVVVGFGVIGLLLIRHDEQNFTTKDWGRVIVLELAAFSAIALLSIFGGVSLNRAELGYDGGLVGWAIAKLLGLIFGVLPGFLGGIIRFVILLGITAFGTLFGLGLFGKVLKKVEDLLGVEPIIESPVVVSSPVVSVGTSTGKTQLADPEKKSKRNLKRHIPAEHRKAFKVDNHVEDKALSPQPRDDRLPSLDLLALDMVTNVDERHINQTAGLLEKTLAEFGVPAKVVGFKVGPTVTQFAVEPGYIQRPGIAGEENRQKVRVSQISALQKDIALALSAERLRIQAPVPGRSYVGIEVPNASASMVRLRPILESEAFYRLDSRLSITLGRDVSGIPIVADLSQMPHLLIAGTTGSGKSVGIAAIIACLVMNNTPEDLRLVMIDPKRVELVRFNGLPHLYGKVETNLERINAVLRWVIAEMQRRYKILEELKVRDIDGYNNKVRRRKDYETIPRIVVIIDELADLMMSAAEQTETTLVRLAQMARATGIHLVVATQRPSTDVVTGLIKANFPARISFAVASGVDSRVILDSAGAESLLGRGDMLFLSPEAPAPKRCQGVMVSDQELENLVSYWQRSWQEKEQEESPWENMLQKEAILADRDDLVESAIELIKESGRASASMIQRRLRIGYPRAARLMDELEDLGIVGPTRGGGKEREILINIDEDEEFEL